MVLMSGVGVSGVLLLEDELEDDDDEPDWELVWASCGVPVWA